MVPAGAVATTKALQAYPIGPGWIDYTQRTE